MTFIKKVSLKGRPKAYNKQVELKVAIANIRKFITKHRTAARRSTNPTFVIDREHKVEKLSMILADLNMIMQTQ